MSGERAPSLHWGVVSRGDRVLTSQSTAPVWPARVARRWRSPAPARSIQLARWGRNALTVRRRGHRATAVVGNLTCAVRRDKQTATMRLPSPSVISRGHVHALRLVSRISSALPCGSSAAVGDEHDFVTVLHPSLTMANRSFSVARVDEDDSLAPAVLCSKLVDVGGRLP